MRNHSPKMLAQLLSNLELPLYARDSTVGDITFVDRPMGIDGDSTDSKNATRSPQTGGDEFAARFAAAHGKLVVIAAAVSGDASLAEDVVQEAALVAVRKRAQFRPGTSFAAWMSEIVRNCALNLRSKVARRRTSAVDPTTLNVVASISQSPEPPAGGELEDWQPWFDDAVRTSLAQLSEDARICLLLRTVHELTYHEIAEWTGLPEGTAMSHVHRSKVAMRQALEDASAAEMGSNSERAS